MTAKIQSNIERNAVLIGPILQEVSRDDLRPGDIVKLSSVDSATSYVWTLSFTPKDPSGSTASSATLSTPTGQTSEFTVDNEGAYQIRLVVDQGLATQSTQHIRARFLTTFADLKLVSAGERRDDVGVIPVDADPEGWANDQNSNLQKLEGFISKVSTSSRVLYVDANRGTDRSNPQDDFTIAEGYADYSTITAAIAAATAIVPAPSLTQPFFIKIHPGFYRENVALQPHVHLIGLARSDSNIPGVHVNAINTGGVSHLANLSALGEFCYVEGIQFDNTELSQTQPVLDKTGAGTLYLNKCYVFQQPSTSTSGQPLLVRGGKVVAFDSVFQNNNGDAGIDAPTIQQATAIEGANTELELYRCTVTGIRPIEANKDGLFDGVKTTILNSQITSNASSDVVDVYGILSSGDVLRVLWCEVIATPSANPARERAVDIHRDGGVKGGNGIDVDIRHTSLQGRVFFNTDGMAAPKTLNMGAVDYTEKFLTGANTGTLTYSASTQGDTILFDNTASGVAWENMQEALDQIAALLTNTGVGSVALSLDTAYDGVTDPNAVPPVIGSGNGRQIVADAGALQITGAATPLSTLQGAPAASNGRAQIEGGVEIGAVGVPEISLDPNPGTVGPEMVLGNTVFPIVDDGAPTRSIPAGILRARATGDSTYHNYNLRITTQATEGEGVGTVGRIVVKPGDSLPSGPANEPLGGALHLEAGSSDAVAPGDIYLAPGHQAAPSTSGLVYLSNPSAQTPASLEAENAFVTTAGGTLTLWVGGVGRIDITIPATAALVDIIGAINGEPAAALVASDSGGKLLLTTRATGPNADVMYAFDANSGTLNTELGNLIYVPGGAGAAYVRGTFAEAVGLGCNTDGELTIYGNLNVTGSIGVSDPKYARTTVNNAASPYAVLASDVYIGVDVSAGPVTLILDANAPAPQEGRYIIIKDESGNAATNNVTIQVGNPVTGTIDGSGTFVLSNDYTSVTVVSEGNNPNTRYYVI